MPWIHCDMATGNCVGITYDENFSVDNLSEKMRTQYFHAHSTESIEDVLPLIQPVFDGDEMLHKFKGWIDQADLTAPEQAALQIGEGETEVVGGSIATEDINVRT